MSITNRSVMMVRSQVKNEKNKKLECCIQTIVNGHCQYS